MTVVTVGGQFIVNNNVSSITTAPLTTAMSVNGIFNHSEIFQTTPWSVSSNVALNSTQSATAMVENILRAGINVSATALDEAFIQKKLTSLSVQTSMVPVPSAFWLFGSALTGVLVSRRRTIAA